MDTKKLLKVGAFTIAASIATLTVRACLQTE